MREKDRESEKKFRSSLKVSGSWATIAYYYYILVFIGAFYLGLSRLLLFF